MIINVYFALFLGIVVIQRFLRDDILLHHMVCAVDLYLNDRPLRVCFCLFQLILKTHQCRATSIYFVA